jgi:Flagellar basal body-associated protein FliL
MMSDHKGGETSRPRKWVLIFILGAMVAGSFISLKYPQLLRIPQRLLQKAYNASQSKGQVKCSVAYSVGERHYLRLKISIVSNGNRQWLDLTRNLPRFKHELLMELGRSEMKEAVKNRDFKTLKVHFIRILNRIVNAPVKKVYIENFFYD